MDTNPSSDEINFTDIDLKQINKRIEHNRQAIQANRDHAKDLIQRLLSFKEKNRLRQLESISISIFEQLIYTFGLTDTQIAEIFDHTEEEIRRFHFKCDYLRDSFPITDIYSSIVPVIDVEIFSAYFHTDL